ncbi:pentatricopeptide repeat-containing protein mitochondrial [Dorcoceras hygrometricum]|uniref:Pentatricopeptide repeat-containing protein mitochondrial n=1 Tax=Dorcoceras hygrometricum TaxID=472368 RepID=A0A2Z7DCA0_9LAMI|nr:pentatricopeptide repeat-containing protein mitochondrial [Dorcoceras hygrometricum]
MKRDQLLRKQALKQRESWISDDDISSDVITISRKLKLSTVVKRSAREKRRRTGRSISRELQCNQQLVFGVSDSKTMSFGLMDTTAFCLRAKDSADGLAMIKSADATIVSAVAQRRVKYEQLRRRNDTQLLGRNQRSKWKESMAEIESCILPGIKGTRFVLFWEIVQFTEEHCTHLERRKFSLDKRRKDLDSLSNGYIQTEAYILREAPLKTVGRCEAVAENTLIAQCTSRGKMNRKTKQSTAIREELSRESIAEF